MSRKIYSNENIILARHKDYSPNQWLQGILDNKHMYRVDDYWYEMESPLNLEQVIPLTIEEGLTLSFMNDDGYTKQRTLTMLIWDEIIF